MKTKRIITLGRQYCSGGRMIGKRVADFLGIPFYDKELIRMASEESGIGDEFFEKVDEKVSRTLLSAIATGYLVSSSIFPLNDYLSNESLFKIQSEVIKKIASAEPCLIVGRCADYILRDIPLLRIFITASFEDRIERVMERHCTNNPKEAREILEKMDKKRGDYYNYYTDKKWGDASAYDLCINSSLCGADGVVKAICDFLERL